MTANWYSRDISHPGLGTFQRIRGTDAYVVEQRAAAKMQQWEQQWRRRQEIAVRRASAASRRASVEASRMEADERTVAAEEAVRQVEDLLGDALKVHSAIDFADLQDTSTFSDPVPNQPALRPLPDSPRAVKRDFSPRRVTLWRHIAEWILTDLKPRRLAGEKAERLAMRAADERATEAANSDWRRLCILHSAE